MKLRMKAALSVLVVVGACAHSGYHDKVYRDGTVVYRVEAPKGPWRRLKVRDNNLAWVEDRNGTLVQVNGRCGRQYDIPLRALTFHLLAGFNEAKITDQREQRMLGHTSLESEVNVELDGVERVMVLRVLKKDGCLYDFAIIADNKEVLQRYRMDFERVVFSFDNRL